MAAHFLAAGSACPRTLLLAPLVLLALPMCVFFRLLLHPCLAAYNFDKPEAFDEEAIMDCLLTLKAGRPYGAANGHALRQRAVRVPAL